MSSLVFTCSKCLRKDPNALSQPIQVSIESRQDSIMLIQSKVQDVERLIAEIEKEKSALLRSLNDVQSVAMSLPNEVLSVIFEFACPQLSLAQHDDTSDKYRERKRIEHFQLVLSAVSTRWRAVAHSTPGLWTCITLGIDASNLQKKSAILGHYLRRTESVPLALTLDLPPNVYRESGVLIHPSVDQLLVQNLPRVKKLHLTSMSRAWIPHLPSLSGLVTCFLGIAYPTEPLTFSQHAPLQHLTIDGSGQWFGYEGQLDAPWALVTALNLHNVRSNSMAILAKCPNLIHFRISLIHESSDPPVTLVAPQTLQCLEVLEVDGWDCGWIRATVQHLSFLVLKELMWDVKGLDSNDPSVKGFFSRLPGSLANVDVNFPLFQHLSNEIPIQNLSIVYQTASDFRSLLLQLIPKKYRDREINVATKLLPQLKRLELCHNGSIDNLPPLTKVASVLYKFLEFRLDIGTGFCFRADIDCRSKPRGQEDEMAYDELVELAEGGIVFDKYPWFIEAILDEESIATDE